jgi:hypothetical protein
MRYREQGVAPALSMCFHESPPAFVASLHATMEHCDDSGWQAVEAVMFAARAVSVPVKIRLRALNQVVKGSAPPSSCECATSAQAAEELRQLTGFLELLMGM